MPTASEAAGRANASTYSCGAAPGTSTWTTNGPRGRTQPLNRAHDSYLERFQELKKRRTNKSGSSQGMQDNTEPATCENDGTKETSAQKTDSGGSRASGKQSSEVSSRRKSQLCVVL